MKNRVASKLAQESKGVIDATKIYSIVKNSMSKTVIEINLINIHMLSLVQAL